MEGENAYQKYLTHLHQHTAPDQEYFRFDESAKHANIRLGAERLEATYLRSMPSKPVAIASSLLTKIRCKFGIEIVKLDTKAIFFSNTTIFIGICMPSYVRGVGYRKINEASRGAYLIGSSGWSYHHKDP